MQRLTAQWSSAKVWTVREQCAEVKVGVRGAPDSEQHLSGAAPDYPVRHEVSAPMVRIFRTLTVGWHGWHTGQCPVAHRTVRCALRQTASPTAMWWLRAINTPNHHHSKNLSFSDISFNTRASVINTRHNSKESKPLQVPNSLQTPSD
jgi:hypothetical protein